MKQSKACRLVWFTILSIGGGVIGYLPMLWAALLGTIHIHQAWIRAVPPNARTAAAYMILENTGTQDDQLIGARSSIARTVELHAVQKQGDLLSMTPVQQIDIPAHGSTSLQPGGVHLMLIDLTRIPKVGEEVSLVLIFQQAGEVELHIPVQESQMRHQKLEMKPDHQHMQKSKTN